MSIRGSFLSGLLKRAKDVQGQEKRFETCAVLFMEYWEFLKEHPEFLPQVRRPLDPDKPQLAISERDCISEDRRVFAEGQSPESSGESVPVETSIASVIEEVLCPESNLLPNPPKNNVQNFENQ